MLHFLEHHINSLLKLSSHNYLLPSFAEVKFQGRSMSTATRATSKSVVHRPQLLLQQRLYQMITTISHTSNPSDTSGSPSALCLFIFVKTFWSDPRRGDCQNPGNRAKQARQVPLRPCGHCPGYCQLCFEAKKKKPTRSHIISLYLLYGKTNRIRPALVQ